MMMTNRSHPSPFFEIKVTLKPTAKCFDSSGKSAVPRNGLLLTKRSQLIEQQVRRRSEQGTEEKKKERTSEYPKKMSVNGARSTNPLHAAKPTPDSGARSRSPNKANSSNVRSRDETTPATNTAACFWPLSSLDSNTSFCCDFRTTKAQNKRRKQKQKQKPACCLRRRLCSKRLWILNARKLLYSAGIGFVAVVMMCNEDFSLQSFLPLFLFGICSFEF